MSSPQPPAPPHRRPAPSAPHLGPPAPPPRNRRRLAAPPRAGAEGRRDGVTLTLLVEKPETGGRRRRREPGLAERGRCLAAAARVWYAPGSVPAAAAAAAQEPVGLGGVGGLPSAGRRWRRVQERAAARAPLSPMHSARPPACDGCCLTHIPGGALRRGPEEAGGGGGAGGAECGPSRGGAAGAVRAAGEGGGQAGRAARRCCEGREGLFRRRLVQVRGGVPVGVGVALRLAPIVTLSGLRPWHSLTHTHSLTHNRACCHRPPARGPPPAPAHWSLPPGRAASLAPAAAAGTVGKGERCRGRRRCRPGRCSGGGGGGSGSALLFPLWVVGGEADERRPPPERGPSVEVEHLVLLWTVKPGGFLLRVTPSYMGRFFTSSYGIFLSNCFGSCSTTSLHRLLFWYSPNPSSIRSKLLMLSRHAAIKATE
ncbi:translation initiation factor IF-2-like [Grus americana]|uniref:translation initiation factor IF-2-like n=1 Tax=Grus americana TaxID=9117 RepID=UPI0024080491|nr:translation initiation factor IF-2-like [Grus americana]